MVVTKTQRKFFKTEAKKVIFAEWLNAIFATSAAVLVTAGLAAIQSAYLYLLSERMPKSTFYALSVFFNLLAALVFLPVLYGYFVWCIKRYEGTSAAVSTLFDVFSGSALRRVYATIFAVLLRSAALFALPVLIGHVADINQNVIVKSLSASDPILPDLYLVALNAVLLLLYFFAFTLATKQLFLLYISIKQPDQSLRMCGKTAEKLMRGHKIESVIFFFSFFGWILLSLFSAGLLFVVFVIPYMLLSSVSYFSYLYAGAETDLQKFETASLTKTIIKE